MLRPFLSPEVNEKTVNSHLRLPSTPRALGGKRETRPKSDKYLSLCWWLFMALFFFSEVTLGRGF